MLLTHLPILHYLVLVLVVSSTRQRSFNWLVTSLYMLWLQLYIDLMRSHLTSQPFSEHHAKATLLCWQWGWSLTGCLSSSVVLLRPKLRRDRHLRDSPIHEGYTVPNVESQIFTPQLPVPGIEPVPPAVEAGVIPTTPPAPSGTLLVVFQRFDLTVVDIYWCVVFPSSALSSTRSSSDPDVHVHCTFS